MLEARDAFTNLFEFTNNTFVQARQPDTIVPV
jgi:hypothetical protein